MAFELLWKLEKSIQLWFFRAKFVHISFGYFAEMHAQCAWYNTMRETKMFTPEERSEENQFPFLVEKFRINSTCHKEKGIQSISLTHTNTPFHMPVVQSNASAFCTKDTRCTRCWQQKNARKTSLLISKCRNLIIIFLAFLLLAETTTVKMASRSMLLAWKEEEKLIEGRQKRKEM